MKTDAMERDWVGDEETGRDRGGPGEPEDRGV